MNTSSFLGTVVSEFEDKLVVLSNLLETIGEEPHVRKQWEQIIVKNVFGILQEMVEELNEKKIKLIESISDTMTKCRKIAQELRLENLPDLDHGDEQIQPLKILCNEAETKYNRLKEQLESIKAQIQSLELRESEICSQLGRTPKRLYTKQLLPTENDIAEFQIYLDSLDTDLYERREEFIQLKGNIQQRIKILQFAPNLQYQNDILNDDDWSIKLSDTNMQNVRRFDQDMERRYQTLGTNIQTSREKLQSLWELLEVNHHERSIFLENCTANDFAALEIIKSEISKLEEQKRLNIEHFLKQLRHELQSLWNTCLMSDEQKSSFKVYLEADFYTEELLEIHELEVEKVKSFYKKNNELYNLFSKRSELMETLIDLEENANDPNRFKNRGGALLKQQKEKKAAEISLPKVEKAIIQLANTFEEINGQPFLIHGRDVRKIIEERIEQIEQERQLQLSARKARLGLTPTPGKTPLALPRTPRTNMSCRRNLLTPLGGGRTPLSSVRTAPPKMLHTKKTISKQTRLSMEKAKKVKKAIKRLSQSSRKENDQTLLNKTRSNEYKDFLYGAQFTRSTTFCLDKEQNLIATSSRSPLAVLLPKSPIGYGRTCCSPIRPGDMNKFSAITKNLSEKF